MGKSDISREKTLFDYYPEYHDEEILDAIYRFPEEAISLLKKAYGEDFRHPDFSSLSDAESKRVTVLRKHGLKNRLEDPSIGYQGEKKRSSRISRRLGAKRKKESFVTGSFVHDRLSDLSYTRLSREEEIDFIKKVKLSYYDSVDDDTKQLYLSYYEEMFPRFKESYEKAEGDKKERLLRRAIANSTFYRDQFLDNNSRLVMSIVNKYSFYNDTEAMYQEGTIGMMKALEKFDISLGNKFSTYATWWIRQAITRFLCDNEATIRIPVHVHDTLRKVDSVEEELIRELGRFPTDEEVAERLNISLEEFNSLLIARKQKYSDSLDDPIYGEEEDTTLLEMISDDSISYTDLVEDQIMFEQLRNIIDNSDLSVRDKKVLYMRFGLNDGIFKTLDEVGTEFGVTRERVRQIEARILAKLRTKLSINHFHFYDGFDDYFTARPMTVRRPVNQKNDAVKEKTSSRVTVNGNYPKSAIEKIDFQKFNDSRKRRKAAFEEMRKVLLSVDLSQFDFETQEILRLRYGLGAILIDNTEKIAAFLDLSVHEVEEKENDALSVLLGENVSDNDSQNKVKVK